MFFLNLKQSRISITLADRLGFVPAIQKFQKAALFTTEDSISKFRFGEPEKIRVHNALAFFIDMIAVS